MESCHGAWVMLSEPHVTKLYGRPCMTCGFHFLYIPSILTVTIGTTGKKDRICLCRNIRYIRIC